MVDQVFTQGNSAVPVASTRPALIRLRAIVGGLVLLAAAGCQQPPVINAASERISERTVENKPAETVVEELILQSGDTLRISFPGAANLDTSLPIRTDGRINLPMVGEVVASGKTPSVLEKELMGLYASKLVSKEVSVTVVSSPFSVFVTGAVMHPGKIVTDHPISALEAVMEAGGFDNAKANTSAVVVVRKVGTGTKSFKLDLKQILEGRKAETFLLHRSDIVNVPEKFTWF
jgi:polysaccharide export outer membrane protein